MKAITTRYLGPTNTRGARIVADDGDGNRASVPYPDAMSGYAAHAVAVRALCSKLGWTGTYVPGAARTGYVWVDAATPERVDVP